MKGLSMISLPGVVDSLHGLVGDAGAEEDDVDAAGVVAGGELDAEALAVAHHDVVEHVLEVVDGEADVRVRHLLDLALTLLHVAPRGRRVHLLREAPQHLQVVRARPRAHGQRHLVVELVEIQRLD